MRDRYSTIVVGAGIAGLGVGAILAREAGQEVLVLDRFPRPGGRLMSFKDYPREGWTVDIGLHLIELGEKASCTELNNRVGKEVRWAPFSQSVELWDGQRFVDVAELVPMTDEDKAVFRGLLQRIAMMKDDEIESWDNRSLEEWLSDNIPQPTIRELFTDIGMIMTTIPRAIDMAAGEVLYIARENLQKTRQVLQASYPLDGMGGITGGLVEVLRENQGHIETNCEVREVVIEGGLATGVRISTQNGPYPEEYRLCETDLISADRVVCALPIYQLHNVLDFNPGTSPLPGWWLKRIVDIRHEITGLIRWWIPGRGVFLRPWRQNMQGFRSRRSLPLTSLPRWPPKAGSSSTRTSSASTPRRRTASKGRGCFVSCGTISGRCFRGSSRRWNGGCPITWTAVTAWRGSLVSSGVSSPRSRRPVSPTSSLRATRTRGEGWPRTAPPEAPCSARTSSWVN